MSWSAFIREVRKQHGSKYPPSTFHELVTSIQKQFELYGDKYSLLTDKIRLALDYEMQESAKEGNGMTVSKALPISYEEEGILWEKMYWARIIQENF